MTKEQWSRVHTQRGIISKLFKYLEFKGILYSVPYSETMEGWDIWRDKVKKEHPIQYFIRDSIESIEYGLMRRYRRLCYLTRTTFFPENKRIRAAIPVRGHDTCSTIINMNFAAILQFKEEADNSYVEWDARDCDKEFKDWLDSAVVWINEGKVKLEAELMEAYPSVNFRDIFKSDPAVIQDLYKEVYRIEALIKETDENILVQLMKYREHFWT
jgi:hypothetical protein